MPTENEPNVPPTDRSLLRRIQLGNQEAATQLYWRYAERLRDLARSQTSSELARREDPEDIVQSVFTSFFRGLDQGYYAVPAGEELWKLLLVIALNKIRAKGTYHRAAKRDVRLTMGSELLDKFVPPKLDRDDAAYTILKLVIDDLLQALPAAQQQMVALRIEGFEIADIATQTKRSKRTVERSLQEFRTQLSQLLKESEA